MITEIGLEVRVSNERVRRLLGQWFPSFSVGEVNELVAADQPWPPIVFEVVPLDSEYRSKISLCNFPGPEGPENADLFYPAVRELARRLAEHFDCRTICEAIGFGDPEGYPGTALVWEGGKPFLADDYGTDFGDGEGGPVRIRRPLELDSEKDAAALAAVLEEALRGEVSA